jgi:hypothetical protein
MCANYELTKPSIAPVYQAIWVRPDEGCTRPTLCDEFALLSAVGARVSKQAWPEALPPFRCETGDPRRYKAVNAGTSVTAGRWRRAIPSNPAIARSRRP